MARGDRCAAPGRVYQLKLESEVLRDDFFGLGGFALGARAKDRGDGNTRGVELLRDDVLEESADAAALGVTVVLESLVGDALDGDASASLTFCHVVLLPPEEEISSWVRQRFSTRKGHSTICGGAQAAETLDAVDNFV